MNLEKIKQSPNFVGSVTSGTLKMLPRPQTGEFVYLTDEDEIRIYNGSDWVNVTSPENNKINTGLSLLEINRSAVSKLKCYSAKHFKDRIDELNHFAEHQGNKFYMMYGKEIGYFTVFAFDQEKPDFVNFGKAVLECLSNIGEIYSIDKDQKRNSTAYEIWVKPKGTSTPTLLYLFAYDDGIVKVGRI